MAIKRSVNTTNNPSLGPKFNFYEYKEKSTREPFYNNDTDVDFVTYEGSLYVCVDDRTPFVNGDPSENGFLLLVQRGADGRNGVPGERGPKGDDPNYQLKFDGKQLIISDDHGVRKAVSPNLTGPVWFPQRQGDYLRWVRKPYDDGSIPEDINLEDLRSVEEHPVLFRLDSDNTKRPGEESGPGTIIQWKKEGQEEWTNLIYISDLMNLALAGVCFWDQEDPDGINRLHFGHRRVLKATYDSQKLGNRKIAEVELDEGPEGVLFDAGAIPYPGGIDKIKDDVSALTLWLCQIKDELKGVIRTVNGIGPDCNGNVTISTPASDLSDVVKSVSVNNGSKISPDSAGNVNLTIQSGSESGSTVSVNQILSSGTPIASITVEDSSTILYAPNAGGIGTIDFKVNTTNNHLEYKIDGGNWIDAGQLPSGGTPTDLNNLKLRITTIDNKKYLQISRDGGSNWGDNMELPTGGNGGGLTQQEVENLISSALSDYLTQSIADNRYILKSGLQGVEYYRTFQLFQRTNSTTTSPTKPDKNTTNIKWDPQTQTLINIPNAYAWKQSPDNASQSTPYLWTTCATFKSVDGTILGDWQDPVCMTGENGQDGEDGEGIKFIFKLASDAQHAPSAPIGTAPAFDLSWSDDAEGIDTTYRAEFYCYSTRSIVDGNNVWSSWQGPYLWSSYGEDGIDGAGVEYIYYATNNSTLSANEKPSNLIPEVVNGDTYQNINSEFVPKASDNLQLTTGGTLNVDWTDNPTGVSSNLRYEFVSSRKFRYANPSATSKTWSPFSEPKVWSHFGQDGNAIASKDVIVPTSTTVTAIDDGQENTPTTYNISGTIQWRLSHNGDPVDTDFCTVHVGSSANGRQVFAANTSTNGVYSATITNVNSSNLFLHIVWHEGSTITGTILDSVVVPILVAGPQGEPGIVQGLDGPVMRVRTWESGVQYYNGNTPDSNSICYLDVVLYEGDFYRCVSNTNSQCPVSSKNGSDNPNNWSYNTYYWSQFTFMGDAAFRTLLARNAYILNLTSKQVVITDSNDTIVGGMTSSSGVGATISEGTNNEHNIGDIRIWAGPLTTNANLAAAPFTVDNNGVMKATKGYFGNGQNGIWIDEYGIVQFGQGVNVPTSTAENYRIGVTGTSMYAHTPQINNNITTYTVNGAITWELYKNGIKQTESETCEAKMSGITTLTPGGGSGVNGNYVVTATSNGSNIAEDSLFVIITWYTDSTKATIRDRVAVPISIQGPAGTSTVQGLDGVIMRFSEWDNSTDYSDGTLGVGDTFKYLDVVKVTTTNNNSTVIDYYKCISSHTNPGSGTFASNYLDNNGDLVPNAPWEIFSFISNAAFHTLLVDNEAYIQNLTSKQIVITDNNTVVAGMASGSSITSLSNANSGTDYDAVTGESVRIWAGPITSGNLQTAPFRVTDAGHLYATDATVSGNVTANTINIGGNSVMNIRIVQGALPQNPDSNTLYIQY